MADDGAAERRERGPEAYDPKGQGDGCDADGGDAADIVTWAVDIRHISSLIGPLSPEIRREGSVRAGWLDLRNNDLNLTRFLATRIADLRLGRRSGYWLGRAL
jgi:hypothetical protein